MTDLPIYIDQVCKGRYSFISLGCAKNTVDSERMMGLLQLDGYELVREPVDADFVVVNTCGFIEDARTESYGAIDEMLELKNKGEIKGLIVSGCLAERQKEELLVDRPGIDALVGVFGREEVTKVADRLMGNHEQRTVFRPAPIRALPDTDRLRITPQHFAYLKISEGCDRLCTFCDIPRMRGKHASKPMESILLEAHQLAAEGVKELNIVAQDTTYYGIDNYGEPRLTQLLRELNNVDGFEWIRLHYFYPMYISDELIDVIRESKRIIPYIDMPLQHINDQMLKRMSRRVNKQQTIETIDRLRTGIPNLCLRTTMLTGFPGETDDQFEELVEFVNATRFDRLGVFSYSFEEATPSANLPDHIDDNVKSMRHETLMLAQQKIMHERNKSLVNSRLEVMVDQAVPQEDNAWVGRSKADAPAIDSLVFLTGNGEQLSPGQIVEAEIVTVSEYDLIGAVL
ncbi:MAG: 30S ribosomal protein S12 methylthiotransferase RimO [Pirellulaceae bacterium]|jgi:ribosomal protein S12 methylthiotransferase|nr:30S ribosomal protein S12 methylthiotransferase RimO [Pirellulaceae bacterium]|tara:strand:- start:3744 stop:5114 length:1371 start_codon:yes stop_codon:yes gene_type:complete